MEINLVFRKIVRLNHINLLFDLLHHLFDSVLISPRCNRIFMYSFNGRSRNVQTLDVYLPTGKYSGHLIQQSGYIFRMNYNRI